MGKSNKEIGQQEFLSASREELQEKYNHLSKEDIDFLTIKDKLLVKSDTIGIHKYNSLKEKEKQFDLINSQNPFKKPLILTEQEKNQIEEFEKDKIIRDKESEEQRLEYLKSIRSGEKKKIETIPGVPLNKKTLYNGFKEVFKIYTGKDFIENENTLANIEVVIKYFSRDNTFFECQRLIKNVDGVDLIPSFEKGLLIVGSFGNGKSTIIKCFELLINHNWKIGIENKWDTVGDWHKARFKIANCHDVVTEFEGLSTPEEKKSFFTKYSGFRYSFDDMKKEKIASNFGLTNVMQMIIEKRYDGNKLTIGTCNYPDNYPNNLSKALIEFGEKYGGHIYDRIFQMYNIIEFKGLSFRK